IALISKVYPSAATVWLRIGYTFEISAIFAFGFACAAAIAARNPAPPAPKWQDRLERFARHSSRLFLSHSPVLQGKCLKVTVCERYSTAPL
ncbi:hypothetical protein AAIH41_35490, partial [Pseudomonas aeruginosa]